MIKDCEQNAELNLFLTLLNSTVISSAVSMIRLHIINDSQDVTNRTEIAMPEEGSPTLHLHCVMSNHTIISKVPKVLKKNYQSEKYTIKTNFW